MPMSSPSPLHPRIAAARRALPIKGRLQTIMVAGSIALLATACGGRDAAPASAAPAGADTAQAPPPPGTLAARLTLNAAQVEHGGIRWAPVVMGTDASRALVPGEVVANEDRTARLGAPGSGRVTAVRVQPGDRVVSGQVLVILQSLDAGTAQSDVAKAAAGVISAQAQLRYASAARARAERLLALTAIPRQDYDRAVADDEEASASLSQAQSELARARTAAAQLGAGDPSLPGEIVIRSPMSGVVLARSAVPGTVVGAGAPLVVITDPSSVWLSISAPEQFAGLFQVGQRVRFTVPAYARDTFTARLDAVGAGLDSATRTLPVRGIVPNGRVRLKPEMLASVEVQSDNRVPAALVPQDAVQLLDGQRTVFIARPDGKGGLEVERRAVEVGSRSGGRIAVTRGLVAGDVIVVTGAFAVKAQFEQAILPKDEG